GAGETVHDAVHGKHRFGPPRPAIGGVGRLVGDHAAALDTEIRHAVRTEEMRHRVVGQHDAPRVVGAEVEPDTAAHGHPAAVTARGDLDVVELMPGVRP